MSYSKSYIEHVVDFTLWIVAKKYVSPGWGIQSLQSFKKEAVSSRDTILLNIAIECFEKIQKESKES